MRQETMEFPRALRSVEHAGKEKNSGDENVKSRDPFGQLQESGPLAGSIFPQI